MAKKDSIDPRYMKYDKNEVEELLDEVKERAFLKDVTEDEYDALPEEEQQNGDLYLIHEEEEQP